MALKEVGLYWGQTRTASCRRLLMAAKRDLLLLMDVTPPSLAPVTQVRESGRLWGYHKKCEGILYPFYQISAYQLFLRHQLYHIMLTSGLFSLPQSPQQAGHHWTFRTMCFLGLLWVARTSTFPHWRPLPQSSGPPAASFPNPPPPQPLDLFPRASPWSKKSRTTSHSMKMITSPPQAASPPEPLTKVKAENESKVFPSDVGTWVWGLYRICDLDNSDYCAIIPKKWVVLRWNLQFSTHCRPPCWQEVIELMFKLQPEICVWRWFTSRVNISVEVLWTSIFYWLCCFRFVKIHTFPLWSSGFVLLIVLAWIAAHGVSNHITEKTYWF